MEYIDILNIVNDSHLDAVRWAEHEMKKHRRRIELSSDKKAEIKSIISSLDYENSIAGNAYINSNYNAGSTYVDVRENLTSFYLGSVKYLKNPVESIKKDAILFYTLLLQEVRLREMLYAEEPREQNNYSVELVKLFKGHTELISQLIGKSDNEIVKLIKTWAKEKDNIGKPLIENPSNRLKKKYAEELKKAGIIQLSIERFRALL